MNKQTLKDLIRFAKNQSLMNEPFEKVWNMYNNPNRLPNPPKEVII